MTSDYVRVWIVMRSDKKWEIGNRATLQQHNNIFLLAAVQSTSTTPWLRHHSKIRFLKLPFRLLQKKFHNTEQRASITRQTSSPQEVHNNLVFDFVHPWSYSREGLRGAVNAKSVWRISTYTARLSPSYSIPSTANTISPLRAAAFQTNDLITKKSDSPIQTKSNELLSLILDSQQNKQGGNAYGRSRWSEGKIWIQPLSQWTSMWYNLSKRPCTILGTIQYQFWTRKDKY